MSTDNKQPLDLILRRRAAYKTLSEVLNGELLLQAMWMIEERDHNADKLTFLGIVGVTAEIFGIDNNIVSSLYMKLNTNLSLPGDQLPQDPLAEMLIQRGMTNIDKPEYSGTSSSIFKANDILANTESNLNNTSPLQIGKALASEAQQLNCSCMIIARDELDSSIEVTQDLATGILSTGINVIDLGNVPLPMLNFVIHHFDGKAGIMITGGNHANAYGGLTMLVAGEILEDEKIQIIKQRIDNDEYILADKEGKLEHNTAFVHEYIGMVCEDIQLKKPLKIVMQAKKGAISQFATQLFEALGCEVIHLEKDVFEGLAELENEVIQHQANIGFTFDNEGIRLRAVDNEGDVIRSDRLMMLFAKDILKFYPGCQIIHDTRETSNLAIWIKKKAGRALLWKNGSAYMKKQLKQTGAKLAGDMHGHIYFNDRWFGFDDAIYAAVRTLELLSKDSRLSHEVFSELPKGLSTMDVSLDLAAGENQKIVAQLISFADFSSGDVIDIDGLRVDFTNGWVQARAAPSSSALVLHIEADNDENLINLQAKIKNLLVGIKPDIELPF